LFLAAFVVAAAVSAAPSPTPAPNGAAAPADGVYNYTITQAGNSLGKSTVTIKRSDIGLTIHETETVLGTHSFVIDEILDALTLAPKAYVGSYSIGDDSPSVARAAFDRAGATITIDGVPGTAPLPYPRGVKDAYVMEGSLVTGFALLPAQIHSSRATQFSEIVPRQVLQIQGRVEPHPGITRPSGVPAGDAVLSVSSSVNFDAWYDPATFVLHAVSVPSQQVLISLAK
jgi:hypothetical protein